VERGIESCRLKDIWLYPASYFSHFLYFRVRQKHYSDTIPRDFQMMGSGKEKKIPLRAGAIS